MESDNEKVTRIVTEQRDLHAADCKRLELELLIACAKRDVLDELLVTFAKRWNRKFECCVECGMTDSPYAARGKCSRCYQKTLYREMIEKTPRVPREEWRPWVINQKAGLTIMGNPKRPRVKQTA